MYNIDINNYIMSRNKCSKVIFSKNEKQTLKKQASNKELVSLIEGIDTSSQ